MVRKNDLFALVSFFLAAVLAPCWAFAQGTVSPKDSASTLKNPVLTHRPPSRQASAVTPEGRIHLDVQVRDAGGNPVTGLDPSNFKLLDNDQPTKILSFRAFNEVVSKPVPPVEVILVVDTVNNGFVELGFLRQGLEKFLRQNGGHLAQPASILLFSSAGMRIQPRPSTDGNALAEVLHTIKPSVHPRGLDPIQLSLKALSVLAANEGRKPGRKLVLWLGQGWPTSPRDLSVFTQEAERLQLLDFEGLVSLSEKLREAHITLFGGYADSEFHRKEFFTGVKSVRQMDYPNLALEVLAHQTGGRSAEAYVNRDSDLADQIKGYIAHASDFYQISFDPPAAHQADEYHDLKVVIDKPGVTARTTTGYYDQP
jgi:VWFA-related protein